MQPAESAPRCGHPVPTREMPYFFAAFKGMCLRSTPGAATDVAGAMCGVLAGPKKDIGAGAGALCIARLLCRLSRALCLSRLPGGSGSVLPTLL